ncbi:MAG: arsenate reductase (glutaredoxin) [Bacteroidota bacterium]
MLKIYHNPRCRKSRETLQLIKDSGEEPEIIEYLKTPPTEEELTDILEKLELPVDYLIRKNEALFKENFKGKDLSENEWIKVLVENPILIERPLVVKGDQAVIGRPPESVSKLLD